MIVVAIIGNAAEHSTAILVAMKNKMDLAVGIAMGSASQIALFVAPVLVLASYLPVGADGPAVLPDGGVGGDPRRAPGADGRRGRRVELAGRGDAADDLRVLGLAFFFLPRIAGRAPTPPKAVSMERAHGGK